MSTPTEQKNGLMNVIPKSEAAVTLNEGFPRLTSIQALFFS